jgi:hypothetical protein
MPPNSIPETIPFRTLDRLTGAHKAILAVLVLIGVAAVVLAAGHPERLWQALLFNWLYFSSVAMGMVMLAVALHLTNAKWAWSIRRFPLGGVAFLPISFVILPFILLGGKEHLFHHWLHVEGDGVIEAKQAWLNFPGLFIRDMFALVVLFGLALLFAYFSLRPDMHDVGEERHRGLYARMTSGWRGQREEVARSRHVLNRLGVALGILYAILWGIIAIDLAMSLAPHWFSTMFPVAFFMGGFHAGIAFTAIAITVMRRHLGLEAFITRNQYHDLGKMVFAFAVFWMYLQWSQYIVIWYGLLPVEQEWVARRFTGLFAPLVQATVFLVFVMPFFGLLTRPPKKVPAILAFFAGLILIGHWIERYLLVVPSLWEGNTLPLGLTEIGIALGFLGLFLASYLAYLSRVPLLPSAASLAVAETHPVATTTAAPQTL